MLLEHLEKARRHVAEAERHVVQQRKIVAQLRHNGHDVSASEKLLDQFEELYAMHVGYRGRLEKEPHEALLHLSKEEFEYTRKARALTHPMHQQALESWRLMNEIVLVTRVKIEQSRAQMVQADVMGRRR